MQVRLVDFLGKLKLVDNLPAHSAASASPSDSKEDNQQQQENVSADAVLAIIRKCAASQYIADASSDQSSGGIALQANSLCCSLLTNLDFWWLFARGQATRVSGWGLASRNWERRNCMHSSEMM